MSAPQVAVITVASGRHDHLARQREGLRRNGRQPQTHVVVALDDPLLSPAFETRPTQPGLVIGSLDSLRDRPAVAAARNHGAALAMSAGADVLIFLDVDCIPGRSLVERYTETALASPKPVLLSGPVAYLPPPPADGYDLDSLSQLTTGHPARPTPRDDAVVPGADPRLFWSLSFAVRAATWRDLGGFCETYDGYGAEDTDLAQIAAHRGIGHSWIGGAWAYHQYHPTSDPPTQHLQDIIRNATTFRARWGWWPMQGWLTAFEGLGLAHYDRSADTWTATPAQRCVPPLASAQP